MKIQKDFYNSIKQYSPYHQELIATWFGQISRDRIHKIANSMSSYISQYMPEQIRKKKTLSDYRTSPYVLMATAGALNLENIIDLSKFLVDTKLYMGLETSFGKSIEKVVMKHFPIDSNSSEWGEPLEKIEEFETYKGLTREEKSARRVDSVWREIDAACVHKNRRHLMTIKSGVSTINDTQVAGMFTAIRDRHKQWLESSIELFGVEGIDITIGLTYGTDKSTNNKENQILVKLLSAGFEELDRKNYPGVLVNRDGTVRVSRKIGIDYWAYTGNPSNPNNAKYVFLEVLLGLAKALQISYEQSDIGAALNERLEMLGSAIAQQKFPTGNSIPSWIVEDFGTSELTWLAAAMTSFFDQKN